MKTRPVALCAAISLLIGAAITMLSIETIVSEPTENLPKGMTPIIPEVGHTTTPIGNYLIIASILVLIGTGIYSVIGFLKKRMKK